MSLSLSHLFSLSFALSLYVYVRKYIYLHMSTYMFAVFFAVREERWGAGVETQKNVQGEIVGRGRVPFNEPYAPSLSTIHDGA